MAIKSDQYNRVRVIAVQGDFTTDHAAAVRTAVDAYIGPEQTDTVAPATPEPYQATHVQAPRIVLDLEQTSTVDSVALEAMTWAQRRCESGGGQLVVAGADETCRKVLEITRLDRQIDIFSDVAAALKALEQAA